MSERKTYQLAAKPDAVDVEAGLMRDVTIIAFGEAKGHEAFIDDKSLEQGVKLLMGKSLKAYVTHDGAYGDRTLGEVGLFSGFYLLDGKIKASQFQAFDSFRADEPERYNRLFELAAMAPEEFGISIVFTGELAWPLRSGEDAPYEFGEDQPDGAIRDLPSIRIKDIESADFVAQPAATPSLFNQLDESTNGNMEEETLETEEVEETEELQAGTCSVSDYADQESCEAAGETWTEETEELEEVEAEEAEAEEDEDEGRSEDEALASLVEHIAVLEAEVADAIDRIQTLDRLLDGQPALDAQTEEAESKSVRDRYLQLSGADRHAFWKAHKKEILMGK